MYKLFLDDIRYPSNVLYYISNPIYGDSDWVIVRSHNQFIDFIEKNGIPYLVSFDHDLADVHYDDIININYDIIEKDEKTGFSSLKWLCDYIFDNDLDMPEMLFHTANPIGKENMLSYYKNFKKFYKKFKKI